MPFFDTAAADSALDALWGAGAAVSMPASFDVGVLDGDPRTGGVEVPEAGRITGCLNDGSFWNAASGGVKTSTEQTLPTSVGAWSAAAEFWGIWVAGVLFDFGRLDESITVTQAGEAPVIVLAVRFNLEAA